MVTSYKWAMRLTDYLRIYYLRPLLECQRFVNIAVHFISARGNLMLSYQAALCLDEVNCNVHEMLAIDLDTYETHSYLLYNI